MAVHILKEKENPMDRVRKIINAGRAYDKGYYGEEVGVAVLDTGERVIILPSEQEPNKSKGFR